MSILAIILILAGISIFLGICWWFRKDIFSFFKRNKKKIAAAGVAASALGAGGTGALISLTPEGYVPPAQIENVVEDMTHDSVNLTANGGTTVDIFINATGVLVFDFS